MGKGSSGRFPTDEERAARIRYPKKASKSSKSPSRQETEHPRKAYHYCRASSSQEFIPSREKIYVNYRENIKLRIVAFLDAHPSIPWATRCCVDDGEEGVKMTIGTHHIDDPVWTQLEVIRRLEEMLSEPESHIFKITLSETKGIMDL